MHRLVDFASSCEKKKKKKKKKTKKIRRRRKKKKTKKKKKPNCSPYNKSLSPIASSTRSWLWPAGLPELGWAAWASWLGLSSIGSDKHGP